MGEWATEDLGFFVRIVTQQIMPAAFPNEIFAHYSLPAFDATGGPLAQEGRNIESGKFRLGQPAVLVSKLNPRKMRVQTFESAEGLRAVASTEFMVYVPRVDDLELHYLGHLLSSNRFAQRLQAVATGTTNSHVRVKPSETLRWPVRVPPLEEQRGIAVILDAIDESIQAAERVVAKCKTILSGLVATLVPGSSQDAIPRNSKENAISPSLALRSTSASCGRGAWRTASLGELAEILDSRRVPVREEDRPSGSVPYYGANGQQGWIDRALFDEPLILLAEDGGYFDEFADRPIAYRIDGPSWVNNHAHVLRAASGVDQSYLFWSLRNRDIRRWIAGGTRSKLTRGEMEQIVLSRPPLEEQRWIAEILDDADETIRANERRRDKLCQVRSGVAADLLSGRVRTVAA